MSEPGVIPDEVRRLRLEPGDTLIVRCSQFTPTQADEYREYLEAWFPDNKVLVLLADEVAVESAAPEPQKIVGVVTIGFAPVGDIACFATLKICDAHTGESFVGATDVHLRAGASREVTVQLTEILGESGKPIRQHNSKEPPAPNAAGAGFKTVTQTFLVAPRLLGGDDASS